MKKIVLFCVLVLVCTPLSYGQYSFISNNQQLIIDAVSPGLFIARTGFQLCDGETGELFGLNGNEDFGIQYTIGLKVDEGVILNDMAVRPWVYNKKFKKYAAKYQPIFSQPFYTELIAERKFDTLSYKLSTQTILLDTTLYKFETPTFDGKGFQSDPTVGKKNGWIIWVTANDSSALEKNSSIDYMAFRQEVVVDDRYNSVSINRPSTDNAILAGIFLVPYIPIPGTIEFRLCGIVKPYKNTWQIIFPFRAVSPKQRLTEHPSEDEVVNSDDNDSLTPVGKGSGKNENKKRK